MAKPIPVSSIRGGRARENTWATLQEMFDNQSVQNNGGLQYVGEVAAYYDYLGTLNGDLSDYRLLNSGGGSAHVYDAIRYVDASKGDDANNGQYNTPYKTLQAAVTELAAGTSEFMKIYLASAITESGTTFPDTLAGKALTIEAVDSSFGFADFTNWVLNDCGSITLIGFTLGAGVTINQVSTRSIVLDIIGAGAASTLSRFTVTGDDVTNVWLQVKSCTVNIDTSVNYNISVAERGHATTWFTGPTIATLHALYILTDGYMELGSSNKSVVINNISVQGGYFTKRSTVNGASITLNAGSLQGHSVLALDSSELLIDPAVDTDGWSSKYMKFNPTGSDLEALNPEDAIKEVNAKIGSGSEGSKPSLQDSYIPALATNADGQAATAQGITGVPVGDVYIVVNISIHIPSNGDKTGNFYWSTDGGVTALAFGAIVQGSIPYWNGAIAGFELETTDVISYIYNV